MSRQTAALERLVRVHGRAGFPVRDLGEVTEVLAVALQAARAVQAPRARSALGRAAAGLCASLGAAPFLRRTATDDLRHLPAVAELLAAMGGALPAAAGDEADGGAALEPLRRAVASAVANVASGYGTRPPGGDAPCDAAEACARAPQGADARVYCANQAAVCRSGIVCALTEGLAAAVATEHGAAARDGSLCEALTDALLQASYHAPSARQAAAAGAVGAVASLINTAEQVDATVVYMSAELLWNLLDAAPSRRREGGAEGVSAAVCRLAGVALLPAERSGFRRRDKEMRNEALVMAAMLAKGGGQDEADEAEEAHAETGASNSAASAAEARAATCAALRRAGAVDVALVAATMPECSLVDNVTSLLSTRAATTGDGADEEESSAPSSPGAKEAAARAVQSALDAYAVAAPAQASAYCQTRDGNDVELKPLAWGLCTAMAEVDQQARAALAASPLAETLVAYLGERPPAARSDGRLDAPQLERLREDAALALCALAPVTPAEVLAAGAPAAALRMTATRVATGAGLRLLGALAAMPEAARALVDAGAVEVALDIFADGLGGADDLGASDAERRAAAQLLAALCRARAPVDAAAGDAGEDARSRLRAAGGISLLAAELTALAGADATLPSVRALAAVDLVWAAVAGGTERRSLARLVAGGGLAALLALLECGASEHAPLALACLADVLRYEPARERFHSWRSERSGRSAAAVVLALWEAEEAVRGMRNEDGVLAALGRPLQGDTTLAVPRTSAAGGVYGAGNEGHQSPTSLSGGAKSAFGVGISAAAAVGEVVGGVDLLMRVYAVFASLGLDSDEVLGYLERQQKATLVAVRSYARFRFGEVWQDIEKELEGEGVKPTAPDRARMCAGIGAGCSAAASAADEQAVHLGAAGAAAAAVEATFYANKQLQVELEAKARVHKKSRMNVSMKERLEAKLKREQMLKMSFRPSEGYEDDEPADDKAPTMPPASPSPTAMLERVAEGLVSAAVNEAAMQ